MIKKIYQLFEEGYSIHEKDFQNVLYMTTDKQKALQHYEEEKQKIKNDKHFFLGYVKPKEDIFCKDTEYETPKLSYSSSDDDNYEYYDLYIRTWDYED